MREMLRTEAKVRSLKAERKGIVKNGGRAAAKRSSALAQRIERVRAAGHVWRCFGDGIAFEYLDNYALKQTYYSVERPKVKQRAGFLTGKEGLAGEIAYLEELLEREVPALLVDLTDTIRHGDICVLVGPDTHLIEVKAGSGLDARGRRQRDGLLKLQKLFDTDEAEGLRGFPVMTRRVQFGSPDVTYVDELNTCIATALKDGQASVSPEGGVHYVALTEAGPGIEHAFAALKLDRPWVLSLNEFKAEHAWAPYYPFVLSIVAEASLWAFVRGDVYLMVVIEPRTFTDAISEAGYVGEFDFANEDYPLSVKDKAGNEITKISRGYLKRVALEFVSPRWLVKSALEVIGRRHAGGTPSSEDEALR